MTILDKSEILKLSHNLAGMVGYNFFPTILSRMWKNRTIEYHTFPSKNHNLAIKEGVNSSINFYIALLNVGSSVEKRGDLFYVKGTDFCLETFNKGKVFLTKKSIEYIKLLLYEKTLRKSNNIITREELVIFLSKFGEGIEYTEDGSITTSSGLYIPTLKGFYSLYKFSEGAKKNFLETRKGKVTSKMTELSIQSSMISFWTVLTKSKDYSISIDYEIGVKTGEKKYNFEESRYDLIININNSYQLIELKKGELDIGVLHHKVGKMEMGLSFPEGLPPCSDYSVIFIGKKISFKLKNLALLFDNKKIKIHTYKSYIDYMEFVLDKSNLCKIDNELANVYLHELKQKIKYAGRD